MADDKRQLPAMTGAAADDRDPNLGIFCYLTLAYGISYAGFVWIELIAMYLKRIGLALPGMLSTAAPCYSHAVMYLALTFGYGFLTEIDRWASGKKRYPPKFTRLLLSEYAIVFWAVTTGIAAFWHGSAVIPHIPAGLNPVTFGVLAAYMAVNVSGDMYEWSKSPRRRGEDDLSVLKYYYELSEAYRDKVPQHIDRYGFITAAVFSEKFGIDRFDAGRVLHLMEGFGQLRRIEEDGQTVYIRLVYRLSDEAGRELEEKKNEDDDQE